MGSINFLIKKIPDHLFEDHFTSFDSVTWETVTNLVAPTIVNSTWLNWEPNATYGQLVTKNLGITPTGTNYKITARVRNIGAIVQTLTCFGLKYEGSGMHWYKQAASGFEVFLQNPGAAYINWVNGSRGIREGTSDPINIVTSQKDGVFSMSVAYEEVSYQIYDWSDSVSFAPSILGSTGELFIGQGYGSTHWEVDYITLDLPD